MIVYLLGLPGVGKSTALEAAIADWRHVEDRTTPFAHRVFTEGIVLGRYREGFPGTDTLSMSVNPLAVDFVRRTPGLIVGEGDRLANRAFLGACPELTLIHLDAPPRIARERARMRAAALGVKEQDASWWKARITKIDHLRARFPHHTIDASQPAEQVARELRWLLRQASPPQH